MDCAIQKDFGDISPTEILTKMQMEKIEVIECPMEDSLDYKCLINPTSDAVNGCGVNVAPSDIVFYDANATGDKLASFNKYGRDAMQPWGYSPSTKTFVTFDDVWSVRAKT